MSMSFPSGPCRVGPRRQNRSHRAGPRRAFCWCFRMASASSSGEPIRSAAGTRRKSMTAVAQAHDWPPRPPVGPLRRRSAADLVKVRRGDPDRVGHAQVQDFAPLAERVDHGCGDPELGRHLADAEQVVGAPVDHGRAWAMA